MSENVEEKKTESEEEDMEVDAESSQPVIKTVDVKKDELNEETKDEVEEEDKGNYGPKTKKEKKTPKGEVQKDEDTKKTKATPKEKISKKVKKSPKSATNEKKIKTEDVTQEEEEGINFQLFLFPSYKRRCFYFFGFSVFSMNSDCKFSCTDCEPLQSIVFILDHKIKDFTHHFHKLSKKI